MSSSPAPSMALSRRDRAMQRAFDLRAIPLFAALTVEELLPVAYAATEVAFDAGDVVCREGDAAERLYVIVRGRAEVSTRAAGAIAELAAGDCFGEIGVLHHGRRSASVKAIGPMRALALTREDVGELLDHHPAIARSVAAVLARRLRGLIEPRR